MKNHPWERVKGYFIAKQYALEHRRNTHPADRGLSHLNILREFPLYRANMDGDYKTKARISANGIKNAIPLLRQLAATTGHPILKPANIETYAEDEASQTAANQLRDLFNSHGSDKSSLHNYHLLYGMILKNPSTTTAILEIGLGTNNVDVPSNMGVQGKPGASLRAWRSLCTNASIFGADIDTRVLFQEQRIQTFFLDQTSESSWDELGKQISRKFDLIIDDGLHAIDANIRTLMFGLKHVKPKGWIVIEDIPVEAQALWQVIGALLPAEQYASHLISARNAIVFAVQAQQ
jgi:hypothetical protein